MESDKPRQEFYLKIYIYMHIKFYLSTPEGMTLITEHNFGIRLDFETILKKSIIGSLQSIIS